MGDEGLEMDGLTHLRLLSFCSFWAMVRADEVVEREERGLHEACLLAGVERWVRRVME